MFSEEFEILFKIVEEELGLKKEDVKSSSRKGAILDSRRIISFIAKNNSSKLSLSKIGEYLGGKDHATVLNAISKHKELYASDKFYIEKFDKVNFKYLSSSAVSNSMASTVKRLNSRKKTITKYIDEQILKIKNEKFSKSKNLNIGLFMGSFNPIHNGHMIIANTALHSCDFDEVWFVISPQSPDKIGNSDLLEYDSRVELLSSSIMDNPSLKICSIERDLPKPSYTANTMEALREEYQNYTFSLIIGSDNLEKINEWKNYERVVMFHKIYYFVRPGFGDSYLKNAKIYNTQEIESISTTNISSTKIRHIIRNGKSIEELKYLIPDECMYIIEEKGYYKENKVEKSENI